MKYCWTPSFLFMYLFIKFQLRYEDIRKDQGRVCVIEGEKRRTEGRA